MNFEDIVVFENKFDIWHCLSRSRSLQAYKQSSPFTVMYLQTIVDLIGNEPYLGILCDVAGVYKLYISAFEIFLYLPQGKLSRLIIQIWNKLGRLY